MKDGLGDQEIAEKVEVGSNFVWGVRAASGMRLVSERQLEIAKAIVARKRPDVRALAASPVGPKRTNPHRLEPHATQTW